MAKPGGKKAKKPATAAKAEASTKRAKPRASSSRADHSCTVNGVVADPLGAIYTVVAYYDGESFYSFAFRESDVASATGPNERTTLLEKDRAFTDIWRSPSGVVFIADGEGQVHRNPDGNWISDDVSTKPLTTVWGLDDAHVYAAGDAGVVYRFDGNVWQAISRELGGTILCVQGSESGDLYACGERGLLWHGSDHTWSRIELPTRATLVGLLCVSPKDVLVCGHAGTMFRGARDAWTDVSMPGHDFFRMASVGGTIHIAAGGKGLLAFDGKALETVKDNIPFYRLASTRTVLTGACGNIAARFDGKGWFGATYT